MSGFKRSRGRALNKLLRPLGVHARERQPVLEQRLRSVALELGHHALFDLRHGRLLHRLDVRQSHELTRLERRAIDIDGDLHWALSSPRLRLAARQDNRPTPSGISLIFPCRLVRAGAAEKGRGKTARLWAPAAGMTWPGAPRIKALSPAFP